MELERERKAETLSGQKSLVVSDLESKLQAKMSQKELLAKDIRNVSSFLEEISTKAKATAVVGETFSPISLGVLEEKLRDSKDSESILLKVLV